jgi:hypothetical protein
METKETNLQVFEKRANELQELSVKYLMLEIKGIEDKEGYKIVDEARKELKRARCDVQRDGKALRDGFNKMSQAIIDKEKELVKIVEPVEKSLAEMQEIIDIEKDKIKRAELLPERKERLLKINLAIADDFILLMDDLKFESFYNEKRSEFLEEKQRLIDEENAKISRQKEIEIEKEKSRIEAEEKARKELDLAKEKAEFEKQEALRKAEKEKQDLIDEQNRKENERIENERLAKEKAEAEENAKKAEQEKLEKQNKYKKFLTDNNYNEETDKIFNTETEVIIYRKIAIFIK